MLSAFFVDIRLSKEWNNPYVRMAAGIALSYYVPGYMGGFLSGFASSGGNLRAGLAGAVSAGMLGGVHGIGGFAGGFAHGAIGGIQSSISGGSFKDGFVGGVASFTVGGVFGDKVTKFGGNLGLTNQKFNDIFSGAVVGGLSSVAAGGQFQYGAFAGGFSKAYNDYAGTAEGSWVDDKLGQAGRRLAGFGARLGAELSVGVAVTGAMLMAYPSSIGYENLSASDYENQQARMMFHYSPSQSLVGGELWPGSYLTTDGNLSSRRVNAGRLENPSGKCLAVEQIGFDNVSNGTALQMQTCSTARSQQWTLGVSGAIVSANALCIDVDLAQYYGQGGKVQTWTCNNSTQQTWAFNNPGQITNWVYDASITTRGKLTSESIGPVGTTPLQTKRYYYDAYGRNDTVTTIINSGLGAGTYITRTTFDSFSRPQTQTYPNESLTIRHQYSTSSGQRIATKDAGTGDCQHRCRRFVHIAFSNGSKYCCFE